MDIIAALKSKLKTVPRPIAAFDADGTLWNTDLGEALFDYQVKNRLVPLPDDPWGHYERLKVEKSHEVAYLWLAQINKGQRLEQVRAWASESLEELQPVPIISKIRDVIDFLHQNQVEVFVVTASIKWAVEPGAKLLGIPSEKVIGIETEVHRGLVSDVQRGVITYRQGKVEGLLRATGGVAPFFCAGNTEGDLPLLESATGAQLVVAASPAGDRNYETERRMIATALQRNWLRLDFIADQ